MAQRPKPTSLEEYERHHADNFRILLCGDDIRIKEYLDKFKHPNAFDAYRVAESKTKEVSDLLSNHNKQGEDKFEFAIHVAARFGQHKIVETLVIKVQELKEIKDANGRTPLLSAAAAGQVEVIEELRKNNCNLFATDKNNSNALHLAATNRNPAAAKYLSELKEGIQLAKSKDNQGRTPVHVAFEKNHSSTAIEILNAIGKQQPSERDHILTSKDNRGCTVFHVAAEHGYLAPIVEAFIYDDHLFNPDLWNIRDNQGRTVFHILAEKGREDILEIILKRNPDLKKLLAIKDNQGQNALHVAVAKNHGTFIRFLNKNNLAYALAIEKDNNQNTTLHMLAQTGNVQLAKTLLEAKLIDLNEINVTNAEGDTALHIAARAGNFQFFDFLLEKNAKTDITNIKGERASDLLTGLKETKFPKGKSTLARLEEAEEHLEEKYVIEKNQEQLVTMLRNSIRAENSKSIDLFGRTNVQKLSTLLSEDKEPSEIIHNIEGFLTQIKEKQDATSPNLLEIEKLINISKNPLAAIEMQSEYKNFKAKPTRM